MRIVLVFACLAACHSSRTTQTSGSAGSGDSAAVAPSVAPAGTLAPIAGDIAAWVPLDRPFLVDRMAAESNVRCALSRDGQVACWGDLTNRQAGPVEIKAGLATPRLLAGVAGAIDVAQAWFFVCVAQRPDAGDGHCFAMKDLGFRIPQFPSPPVQLAAQSGAICARMRDGNVGCITANGAYSPVAGIDHASDLACGAEISRSTCCAIAKTGVRCFGEPNDELDIAAGKAATPLARKLPAVTALALDRSGACARTATGGAVCWGNAERLSRVSGVRTIGASDEGICLVLDGGTLACTSERVPATTHVTQIASTCTVLDDGSARCWGDNTYGQLGDGSLTASLAPVRVPGLDDVVDLAVAHTTACAVRRDHSLHCWGEGGVANVGTVSGRLVPGQYVAGCRIDGTHLACATPSLGGEWDAATIATTVAAITSAAIHRDGSICIVDGDGHVTCQHGMADNGVDPAWHAMPAPGPVEDIQPLGVGFCARLRDGRAACFVDHRYDNDDKFLDKVPDAKLVLVPKIDHVVALATGQDQACVITSTADVWCWYPDAKPPKPVEVPELRGATKIAGNHLHTCAVVRGEVWCWGENELGQIGDRKPTEMLDVVKTPVRAELGFEATEVGVGRDSTCALSKAGQVWCWGSNEHGQLGTARLQRSEKPIRVVGFGPAI